MYKIGTPVLSACPEHSQDLYPKGQHHDIEGTRAAGKRTGTAAPAAPAGTVETGAGTGTETTIEKTGTAATGTRAGTEAAIEKTGAAETGTGTAGKTKT